MTNGSTICIFVPFYLRNSLVWHLRCDSDCRGKNFNLFLKIKNCEKMVKLKSNDGQFRQLFSNSLNRFPLSILINSFTWPFDLSHLAPNRSQVGQWHVHVLHNKHTNCDCAASDWIDMLYFVFRSGLSFQESRQFNVHTHPGPRHVDGPSYGSRCDVQALQGEIGVDVRIRHRGQSKVSSETSFERTQSFTFRN